MGKIVIDKDRCKGCELCVSVCPRDLVEMSKTINAKGYIHAVFKESEECTGCTFCAQICPDVVIEVYK